MFQVANFEYIEEAEATPEEDISTPPLENKATVLNSERATYWEELLRDRYEMHKVEEFNGMGKGKRSRKQVWHAIYVGLYLIYSIFLLLNELAGHSAREFLYMLI